MIRYLTILKTAHQVGQLIMDTRKLAPGLYTVSYTNHSAVLQLDRLIVK